MPVKLSGQLKPRGIRVGTPENVRLSWNNEITLLRDPQHNTNVILYDGFDITGDLMAVNVSDLDLVYMYRKDVNGIFQRSWTFPVVGSRGGDIWIDTQEKLLYVGRPEVDNGEGLVDYYSYDDSGSTFFVTSGPTTLADPTGVTNSRWGENILPVGTDRLVTSLSQWPQIHESGTATFFNRSTKFFATFQTNYINSPDIQDNNIRGYSAGPNPVGIGTSSLMWFGTSMAVTDNNNRLIVSAPGNGSNVAQDGFISVFEYDQVGDAITEVQFIENPAKALTGDSTDGFDGQIAVFDSRLFVIMNVGSPNSNYNQGLHSIVEYVWNGSQYVLDAWRDVDFPSYMQTEKVLAISETELVFGTNEGTLVILSR